MWVLKIYNISDLVVRPFYAVKPNWTRNEREKKSQTQIKLTTFVISVSYFD